MELKTKNHKLDISLLNIIPKRVNFNENKAETA